MCPDRKKHTWYTVNDRIITTVRNDVPCLALPTSGACATCSPPLARPARPAAALIWMESLGRRRQSCDHKGEKVGDIILRDKFRASFSDHDDGRLKMSGRNPREHAGVCDAQQATDTVYAQTRVDDRDISNTHAARGRVVERAGHCSTYERVDVFVGVARRELDRP
jgi:hypothetical protein